MKKIAILFMLCASMIQAQQLSKFVPNYLGVDGHALITTNGQTGTGSFTAPFALFYNSGNASYLNLGINNTYLNFTNSGLGMFLNGSFGSNGQSLISNGSTLVWGNAGTGTFLPLAGGTMTGSIYNSIGGLFYGYKRNSSDSSYLQFMNNATHTGIILWQRNSYGVSGFQTSLIHSNNSVAKIFGSGILANSYVLTDSSLATINFQNNLGKGLNLGFGDINGDSSVALLSAVLPGQTFWGFKYSSTPTKSDSLSVLDSGQIAKQVRINTSNLLWKGTAINFNTTGDNIIILKGGHTYIITDVLITNASVNMTTANEPEIWTGPIKTGTQIADGGSLTVLSSSAKYAGHLLEGSIGLNSNTSLSSSTLYFSLNVAQGSAATADVYVYGYILN